MLLALAAAPGCTHTAPLLMFSHHFERGQTSIPKEDGMRRLIALLLIAALLSTGCGPLLPRTTVVPPAVRGAERAAAFRDAARKMLGKRVTVTMLSGEALSGTLRAAGETTLAIYQPDTRTDTPAKRPARATSARTVDLSYDSIRTIRRPASVGSWMFIGAAVLLVTWPLLVYGGYPD